jgi:ATP-binding cassette subfamily F protein 3
MISINSITVKFGSFEIFSNISFIINKKDRVGLAGKNGAGKSTMLKAIIGEISPEKGSISKPSDTSLGYLPQVMKVSDTTSVIDEAMTAFAEINEIENRLTKLNHEITQRTDYESDSYIKLIEAITELSDRFDVLSGVNIRAEAEKTLKGLGFIEEHFNKATSELSGGWRMRIELAKIILQKPNVLLLDEPTNHLDIEAIDWLEGFLKNYYGAVVLISHDKAFLDNITQRTIEISLGKIYDYKANYSKYIILRKERREQQINAYNNQQKLIGKTEEFIERFRYQATKAVQVQSKIKQLEKVDRIEVDIEDKASIHFKFAPAPRSGTIVIETKDLGKAYGNNLVLKDVNLTIERGDKIAFVGKNGEGKSTLSKIIIGEINDYTNEYKKGHNLKIGYFAQNQETLLDESKTVFETLDDIAVGDVRKNVRNILGSFLFSGEDIDKRVKVLSGGEKTRLALSKLLLEPYNLLVLDEPTNHLDIKSKEVLKNALNFYDGTIIIVSHDRDFLTGLTDKIYEFTNHNLKQFIGDIYDFLEKKKLVNLDLLNKNQKQKLVAKKVSSDNKLNYEERKEFQKAIRKTETQIKKAEEIIEKLELEIKEINDELNTFVANKDYNSLFKLSEDKNKLLEKETENWEKLLLKLEDLQS